MFQILQDSPFPFLSVVVSCGLGSFDAPINPSQFYTVLWQYVNCPALLFSGLSKCQLSIIIGAVVASHSAFLSRIVSRSDRSMKYECIHYDTEAILLLVPFDPS
jgi:hypothetical protein